MVNHVDLTPMVQAVIALAAALITAFVVPWIRARTTEQQRSNLTAVIRALVLAAEGIYGANKGDEKLKYVQRQLSERGFDGDTAAIEAEVFKSFNFFRTNPLGELFDGDADEDENASGGGEGEN